MTEELTYLGEPGGFLQKVTAELNLEVRRQGRQERLLTKRMAGTKSLWQRDQSG